VKYNATESLLQSRAGSRTQQILRRAQGDFFSAKAYYQSGVARTVVLAAATLASVLIVSRTAKATGCAANTDILSVQNHQVAAADLLVRRQ